MEQFNRLTKIISNDKFNKIKNAKMIIVGIGGVGGAAFEMLVRCGVNNITIVDFDTFEESNLNRQILSLLDNVNEYKTDVAKKRALSINKDIKIKAYNKTVSSQTINEIFETNYDYIIDACDDVDAKMLLIKTAINMNIKIISSMGTGNKFHPEFLEITNIWKTEYDPLAKAIRNRMRKEHISYKLPVVSSKEKCLKVSNEIGSVSVVPNAAGILLASYVINDVLK
ncbi:MAG: ThiF family adenylyltransferase [Bacilli bacterium]